MNKKGFTLVELLAVILILSILVSIAVINSSYSSNKIKEKEYENIVEIIEQDAYIYVNSNSDLISKLDDKSTSQSFSCIFYYQLLIDDGLIDEDTVNPITNEVINSNSYIMVTLNEKYEYEYKFINYTDDDYDNSIDNCFD